MGRLARLIRDKRGATAVEYGLIVSLIVVAMLVAFSALSSSTGGLWGNILSKVESA